MNDFIPALLTFLPLFIFAFVFRWIHQIKKSSEIQVEQNKQIILLLQKIDKKINCN